MSRVAYICKNCEGVYADYAVTQCDCLVDENPAFEKAEIVKWGELDQLRKEIKELRKELLDAGDAGARLINEANQLHKENESYQKGLQQWVHSHDGLVKQNQQLLAEFAELKRGVFSRFAKGINVATRCAEIANKTAKVVQAKTSYAEGWRDGCDQAARNIRKEFSFD